MTAHKTFRLGLHLRRTLSLSTATISQTRLASAAPLRQTLPYSPSQNIFPSPSARRNFHSSHHLSFASPSRSFSDIDKIDPETILFEGCDYKHWLIVMDFGKDPNQRPPSEHMIETYVQTCAKIVGSVEEAKRRIYACSTTTYTGFQVEVDEETSKKFENLPGVIFVLPDSYIDPVNKEYGGDKYINGDIIPRPPPVQYGRTGRNHRTDNRRPRDSMPQQGNPPYNQHNSMPHVSGSYTPQVPHQGYQQQQNYPPQQNYGPSGQANRVASIPSGPHNPGVRDGYQGGQTDRVASMPSGPQNPGLGRDGYHGGQRNFVPPQQGNYNQNYSPRQGQMNNHPGNHGGYASSGQYRSDSVDYGYNQPQRQRANVPENHGGYAPTGQLGFSGGNGSNPPHSITGGYEQTGHESFQQSGQGQYGQGQYGQGQYGQGPNGNYDHGPRYAPHGESQTLHPTSNEQKNPMEHRNHPRGPPTGFDQDPLLFP